MTKLKGLRLKLNFEYVYNAFVPFLEFLLKLSRLKELEIAPTHLREPDKYSGLKYDGWLIKRETRSAITTLLSQDFEAVLTGLKRAKDYLI